MTKGCARDARGAMAQLEESLTRLGTDVIDLWQFHECNYDNDPDLLFARDGAIHAAVRAKEQGKVRLIGFTGHKSPHIHLAMLEKHDWDAVLMPINVCDYYYRSFLLQVVPRANDRGVGVLGMKSLGGGENEKGRFVVHKVCSAQEARRFSLSQPITSLVCGIDSMRILEQDLAIARDFQPMSRQEQLALLNRVKPMATDGRHERFKSTQFYDSDHHKKQHGLTEAEVKS